MIKIITSKEAHCSLDQLVTAWYFRSFFSKRVHLQVKSYNTGEIKDAYVKVKNADEGMRVMTMICSQLSGERNIDIDFS